MDLALLSASLHQAGARTRRWARDWGECALGLAFPWPQSAEADPVRIESPFCRQCGYPYPALEGHSGEFTCNNCVNRTWHFEWARSGYRTEGQVLEAVIGFKYRDDYYREDNWLIGWRRSSINMRAANGMPSCRSRSITGGIGSADLTRRSNWPADWLRGGKSRS